MTWAPASAMNSLVDRDREHLRLLSIFHYVFGGLAAVFACFPSLYVLLGAAIAGGGAAQPDDSGQAAAAVGLMVAGIGGVCVVSAWTIAGLIVYAGKCLAGERHLTFCMVIAGIECLTPPLGTILGVFTLVVLCRPSVKELFEARQRTENAEPPDRSE
jgi:hypothetical protein